MGHCRKTTRRSFASWNIGTLTRRARKLADVLSSNEEFQDIFLEVQQVLEVGGVVFHLISAYALQAGYGKTENMEFWDSLCEVLLGIPLAHKIILGGDLNGYVGEKWEEFGQVKLALFEYGNCNREGNEIRRTCVAAGLAIVSNTFSKEQSEPLINFKRGWQGTQID